ncbi:MAG: hypothetical protein PVF68_09025 [Acidobacteriota bacterium]|jgi:hypothetical protein
MAPGELLPAQELYGDLLPLEDGPDKVEVRHRAALARSANRLRVLYGAGMAADTAGLKEEANQRDIQLLEIVQGATANRPALTRAAEFAGRQ